MVLRVKFRKYDVMKYIGHLDIVRFFQKAFRRASIDVKYTEGYSPHAKMSFASPLGIGVESEAEYMDVELASYYDIDEFLDKLRSVMVRGISIIKAVELREGAKSAMTQLDSARYIARISAEDASVNMHEIISLAVDKLNNITTYSVLKKTKKGEYNIDIKPLIIDLRLVEGEDRLCIIDMIVRFGSKESINPMLVVGTIFDMAELDMNKCQVALTRKEMYSMDNTGMMVPLGDSDCTISR